MVFALLFQSRTGLVNAGLHSLFAAWDPEFAWLDQEYRAAVRRLAQFCTEHRDVPEARWSNT